MQLNQLIRDITDLQSESVDDMNIERIVAMNQTKMKGLLGASEEMGIGQKELIEFREKLMLLNVDCFKSQYCEEENNQM